MGNVAEGKPTPGRSTDESIKIQDGILTRIGIYFPSSRRDPSYLVLPIPFAYDHFARCIAVQRATRHQLKDRPVNEAFGDLTDDDPTVQSNFRTSDHSNVHVPPPGPVKRSSRPTFDHQFPDHTMLRSCVVAVGSERLHEVIAGYRVRQEATGGGWTCFPRAKEEQQSKIISKALIGNEMIRYGLVHGELVKENAPVSICTCTCIEVDGSTPMVAMGMGACSGIIHVVDLVVACRKGSGQVGQMRKIGKKDSYIRWWALSSNGV
ncbi:uncharacterized protein EDB93DRAFT_1281175 [Suillus bovinus]|uniref:uncharacterized protein n=1 Tax=Suillus bovinus TaxID=48563 RepID=UPI001B8869AC|nr:uncharacterized protein EDB93DRAFT_1281175 [Suillus bovinus]KAG2147914.1 hypothetical protein EDB93DRAFT_1281175 [Suillus bovinus]